MFGRWLAFLDKLSPLKLGDLSPLNLGVCLF